MPITKASRESTDHTDPLVSIITPTYNHEQWIGDCIQSVFAQEYSQWEMIIIDDGSCDNTRSVARVNSRGDGRIKLFTREHLGIMHLAEAYNFALEQSRGKLIAILEGDDLWTTDKLRKQVPFHIKNGHALSFGKAILVDRKGKPLSSRTFPSSDHLSFLKKPQPKELLVRHLQAQFDIVSATVLVSRKRLIDIGGFIQPDYLPVADYPTWITLGGRFNGYGFLDSTIGYWRKHSRQASWQYAREIAFGALRFSKEYLQDISSNPLNHLGQGHLPDLMTHSRKRYLSDSTLRSSLALCEKGDRRQALSMCFELARMGAPGLFIRCITLMLRKSIVIPNRMAGTS